MKTITKVFFAVGTLLLIFLIWALFFNKDGVLQTGWNALISPVNKVWQQLSGDSSAKLLPTWDAVEQGGSYNGSDSLGDELTP